MRNSGANRLFILFFLTSILLFPNCATVFWKRTQSVPVTSSPAGATVAVNEIQQGVTPLELQLARNKKGQVIRIESPGYNPVEIRLTRRLSGSAILGNFLLGLIPGVVPGMLWGMAHDESENYSSGIFLVWTLSAAGAGGLFTLIDSGTKGYAFKPKQLTVTLTKVDGTPRVDMMYVGAEEFQNVNWIRVHRD